jgi:hypothetical protein
MTSADATPSETLLDHVYRRAWRLLGVLLVLTLASRWWDPSTRLTMVLLVPLSAAGGMVLGILWCKAVLWRRYHTASADPEPRG